MTETSPILSLPYLQASQAQKHVTHNEALQQLDMLVQTVVTERTRNAPPASPARGDRHIIGPAATGDWVGQENALASYDGQSWHFITPQPGWRAYVSAEDREVIFDGTGWAPYDPGLQNLPGLGVGTQSDATNMLAVSGPATLLSHDGAGHQLKLNKASETDTATLLYQSNWSGRAEIGLAGSDALKIKVSDDGTNWIDALSIDPANGLFSGAGIQSDRSDLTPGRLMRTGAFGLGASALPVLAADLDNITTSGIYRLSDASAAFAADSTVLHMTVDTQIATQVLCDPTGAQTAWRRQVAGVWQGWQRLYDSASILGPVSLSAGVPTGALLEQINTPTGVGLRYADGTQICAHRLDLGNVTAQGSGSWGDPYRTPSASWIYPVAFTGPPHITAAAHFDSALPKLRRMGCASMGTPVVNRVDGLCVSRTGDRSDADNALIDLIAIGRWD